MNIQTSGGIIRLGRKILIDEVKFFAWIETGQKPKRPLTPPSLHRNGRAKETPAALVKPK